MNTVTHVLTHNSTYEIDESAKTITRRTILGIEFPDDGVAIPYTSCKAYLNEPLVAHHILDGKSQTLTTSRVLSIMRVEMS